jgi:ABC-type bacteriocin/lantibiotic exporter with double-glycine peptidase domain
MQAVLQQLMTVAVIFSGVMLVFSGSLSAGAIISCNMLGGKITGPVRQMVMFFSELSNFKNIITQISELWNSPSERTGIGSQRILRGNLDFTNVSVIFDNVTALKDISWKIKEGGRVGIVGPAGSGKSTLLRLIQGLLRPNSGVFSIDGIPYSNLNLENYRLQVAMISQSSTFFDGTIESNLRRARPNISEREFSDALNWSGLRGILDELEDGLSTEIDQYASGMSSSHKIIISLARAIISNPKVILFDEVFSNIDKRLSKHVLTNLNNITRGKTFIMATHDISLLHQFDEILVLDRGSVNSTGKHSDLLKSSATYKQLYDLDVDISQGNF